MRRALIALAVLALGAGAARAQPPIWVVRDADSEMVLFGSVHVLPPDIDWRPQALDRALDGAQELWFELPIDPASEARVAQAAVARGLLPAGESLSPMLSAAGAERLARICVRYGVAPAVVERLQPWFAEVALAGALYRALGADTGSGVEKVVAARAPASATRRAFETPEEQIALFDGASRADQIASLEESLEEIDRDPAAFRDLIADWMAGDVAAIERDALGPMREASPGFFRRLVTERNARWTEILAGRMAGAGRSVVVVGVGHLVGEDGVPARLRAMGYQVDGP